MTQKFANKQQAYSVVKWSKNLLKTAGAWKRLSSDKKIKTIKTKKRSEMGRHDY